MSRFDVHIEMRVDGVWTDITDKTLQRDAIQISRGRQDESSRVEPADCSLTLNNKDGRFSPRNPLGPYYGKIGRNTPLRVVLGTPTRANGTSVADNSTSHVAPSVASDADTALLIGAWCSGQQSGNYTVPGSMTAETETDGTVSTLQTAYEALTMPGDTGSRSATFSGTVDGHAQALIAVPGDSDTPVIEDLIVQEDDITISSPPQSIYTDDATEEGQWLLAVQVWNQDSFNQMPLLPSGTLGSWSLVCDTGSGDNPRIKAWVRRVDTAGVQKIDFNAPLTTTTVDQHVRLYVLSNVRYSSIRIVGEVSAWPPRWDVSENDVYVPISVSGILRRLGQGTKPLRSAIYRFVTGQKPDPVAYWSFEDEEGATRIASGIERQPYMAIMKGTPELASYAELPASGSLPAVKDAWFATEIVGYTPTGTTTMQWVMFVPTDNAATGTTQNIFRLSNTGSIGRIDVVLEQAETLSVQLFKRQPDDESVDAGRLKLAGSVTQPFAGVLYGRLVTCMLLITESGGDLHYELQVQPADSVVSTATGNLSGHSLGAVWRVSANYDRALADVVLGHVALRTDDLDMFNLHKIIDAYNGEASGRRIERLCREEEINFMGIGPLDETVHMGPQTVDTLIELIGQCSDADQGVLHETRETLGLTYRTRWTLYNQGLPIPDTSIEGVVPVATSPVTGGEDTGGSGTQTVKTYESDFARSWNANGSMRSGSEAYLYQGQPSGNPGGHGNQKSWIWWDWSQIWADLAGKTIIKAELYLYASHWYFNSGGTAILGFHTSDHRDTYDGNQDNIDEKRSANWPKPGGRWVNITGTSIASSFASGTAKGIAIGPAPSTSLTYYGYFEPPIGSGSKAPKLRFTYE